MATPDEAHPRILWVILLPALAIAAIGGAAIIVLTSSVSYGWFSSAPVSGTVFQPYPTVPLSPEVLLGLILGATGLALLTFWAGMLVARRKR